MSVFWIALAVVFGGGVALALQAPLNSALASNLGDGLAATMISFGVGFAVLVVIVSMRGAIPSAATLKAVPAWMFVGGSFGVFYVWSTIWGVPRLGVVTMVAALILGQLLAAILIDRFGAFGVPVREISWQRIVALVLVGSGLVMSRL